MSTELYAAKIRGYLREARKHENLHEYYTAGMMYQRAARIALKANRSPRKYETQALACFEMQVQHSLGIEDFSEAAQALEKLAKIYEKAGDTQLAAEMRFQASYLRLRGIESLIS
ncbi:MAG: hypothetical protein ACFE89_09750 [Candidatus Hodarchaeota archaeon]